ncbi:unnamed protein product [Calicophoron daubneyi]|uniref:Uncharacterized protein n=1 Tax=Calicophoron daubneyi TaxID=300641 RepID=A0AAV2TNN0_CALDB
MGSQRFRCQSTKELKDASSKLRSAKSEFGTSDCKTELDSLKSQVDLMVRNYDSLQRKYRKQLTLENERNAHTVQRIENEKSSLQAQLRELKATSRQEIQALSERLNTEKSASGRLDEKCASLERQWKCSVDEMNRQRAEFSKLELAYQNRQKELETMLDENNQESEIKAREIERLKLSLENKRSQLRRLSSDAASKESELVSSRDTLRRLEKAVARHLAVFDQDSNNSSPSSASLMQSENVRPAEFDRKLNTLEQKLNRSYQTLTDKIKDISRLESACQTASLTIQRLVRAKTLSIHQANSYEWSLKKAVERIKSIQQNFMEFEHVVLGKLEAVRDRAEKLYMNVSHARNGLTCQPLSVMFSSVSCEANPKEFCLTADGATQTHCANVAENLSLTDLLTHADDYNRTNITCATDVLANIRTFVDRKSAISEEVCHSIELDSELKQVDLKDQTQNVRSTQRRVNPTGREEELAASSETVPSFSHSQTLSRSFLTDSPSLDMSKSHRENINFANKMDNNSSVVADKLTRNGVLQSPSAIVIGAPDVVSYLNTETPNQQDSCLFPHIDKKAGCSNPEYSPSEYGDFVIKNPKDPAVIVPGLASGYNAPSGNKESRDNTSYVSEFVTEQTGEGSPDIRAATKERVLSAARSGSANYLRNSEQQCDNEIEQNGSERLTVVSPEPPSAPQASSTGQKRVSFMPTALYSAEDSVEDTDVYCLAARFLADEQQHSLLLENRIDAHLEALKKQVTICK